MNSLDIILGRKQPIQEMTTASAVPVVATVPSSRYVTRNRDEKKKKHARRASTAVMSVLGETHEEEDEVIPDGAEELDSGNLNASGLKLKDVKDKPRDPDAPQGDGEKLLSPRADRKSTRLNSSH